MRVRSAIIGNTFKEWDEYGDEITSVPIAKALWAEIKEKMNKMEQEAREAFENKVLMDWGIYYAGGPMMEGYKHFIRKNADGRYSNQKVRRDWEVWLAAWVECAGGYGD